MTVKLKSNLYVGPVNISLSPKFCQHIVIYECQITSETLVTIDSSNGSSAKRQAITSTNADVNCTLMNKI